MPDPMVFEKYKFISEYIINTKWHIKWNFLIRKIEIKFHREDI